MLLFLGFGLVWFFFQDFGIAQEGIPALKPVPDSRDAQFWMQNSSQQPLKQFLPQGDDQSHHPKNFLHGKGCPALEVLPREAGNSPSLEVFKTLWMWWFSDEPHGSGGWWLDLILEMFSRLSNSMTPSVWSWWFFPDPAQESPQQWWVGMWSHRRELIFWLLISSRKIYGHPLLVGMWEADLHSQQISLHKQSNSRASTPTTKQRTSKKSFQNPPGWRLSTSQQCHPPGIILLEIEGLLLSPAVAAVTCREQWHD